MRTTQRMWRITVVLFFNIIAVQHTYGQLDTTFPKRTIPYTVFLNTVAQRHLGYAAEKLNVDIANANVLTAGIIPDPTLSTGWFDNGQNRMNMGYGFNAGLSWTLELGGKREARLNVAQSQYELSKLLLQDYFRNLRADATLAYLTALLRKLLLDVRISSYQAMEKLAQSDSVRFRAGAITEVDARQSKLEAGTMLNDVFQAEAEWKAALVQLSAFLGTQPTDTLFLPEGTFDAFERTFSLQELLEVAYTNRADVLAAQQNTALSRNLVNLAQANRVIDVELSVGINYTSYVRNIIAPTPSFTVVGAGIAFPLKFSNNRPGELSAAYYAREQADLQYRQIQVDARSQVTQAYFAYRALQRQVQQFRSGLLTEAKAVLDGKVYSYQRGETSLLEVLNAQRTYNDIQQNYYQTLYNYAAALIELERAAGIWDIRF
ncbi:MAG: TolC family protein [Bacteroidota bacterium]|nr:TolC family protein [Candidatus Kapabacteria bacterium]MDW8219852.1 TolC family protein [Bacteroidota bacterium]